MDDDSRGGTPGGAGDCAVSLYGGEDPIRRGVQDELDAGSRAGTLSSMELAAGVPRLTLSAVVAFFIGGRSIS